MNKTEVLTIRISSEVLAALKLLAAADCRTVNNYVVKLLTAAVCPPLIITPQGERKV